MELHRLEGRTALLSPPDEAGDIEPYVETRHDGEEGDFVGDDTEDEVGGEADVVLPNPLDILRAERRASSIMNQTDFRDRENRLYASWRIRRAMFLILLALAWWASDMGSIAYGSWMMLQYEFDFPIFIAAFRAWMAHQISTNLYTSEALCRFVRRLERLVYGEEVHDRISVICYLRRQESCRSRPESTGSDLLTRWRARLDALTSGRDSTVAIIAMVLITLASSICSNYAQRQVSPRTVESLETLSLTTVILLGLLDGSVYFDAKSTVMSVFVVVGGILSGGIDASVSDVLLATGSTLFFSLRLCWSGRLLEPRGRHGISYLIMNVSFWACAASVVLSCALEGGSMMRMDPLFGFFSTLACVSIDAVIASAAQWCLYALVSETSVLTCAFLNTVKCVVLVGVLDRPWEHVSDEGATNILRYCGNVILIVFAIGYGVTWSMSMAKRPKDAAWSSLTQELSARMTPDVDT